MCSVETLKLDIILEIFPIYRPYITKYGPVKNWKRPGDPHEMNNGRGRVTPMR